MDIFGRLHKSKASSAVYRTAASDPANSAWGRAFVSLSIPDFRTLLFTTTLTIAALQMGFVAQPWLAFEISDSAFTIGLVALARGLPQVALTLFAGVVADRFDKRMVLLVTQILSAASALVNAILVQIGVIEVWHLIVVGMFQGAALAFNVPTRQAYIPELAGHKHLSNALAMDSTGRNLARLVGPAVVGVLLGWDPTIAFYAIAAIYIITTIPIIKLPTKGKSTSESKGAIADIKVGIEYIRNHSVLRTLIVLCFILVLLGMPFQSFLPVFQSDVLEVSESRLGLMFAVMGIGSMVSSLGIAYFSEYSRKGLIQIISGVAFGVFLALFAASSNYVLSLGILFLLGMASQGFLTTNSMLLMTNAEKNLYGRVMSVNMLTWSMVPLTALPIGALVDGIGAQTTFFVVGVSLAFLIAAMAARYPNHWRRESPPAHELHASKAL